MIGSGLSKDNARKARASRHASRGEDCECGRTVYGNGRASHYKTCRPYLERYGWPFNDAEMTALRERARELTDHLPAEERSAAWLKILYDARRAEARDRGLID